MTYVDNFYFIENVCNSKNVVTKMFECVCVYTELFYFELLLIYSILFFVAIIIREYGLP